MTGTRTYKTWMLYVNGKRNKKKKGALACARTPIPQKTITSKVHFIIMLLGSGSGNGKMHLEMYML